MEIKFTQDDLLKNAENIVVLVDDALNFASNKLGDEISALIKSFMNHSEFKAKLYESLKLTHSINSKLYNIYLFGIGKQTELDEYKLTKIGGKIYNLLNGQKLKQAYILPLGADSAEIAFGASLNSYYFDKYFTIDDKKPKIHLKSLYLHADNVNAEKFKQLEKITQSVHFARDLISEPPNVLYPESYAERVEKMAKASGLEIDILDLKKMQKLGMGALIGVAQGSVREPRLVVLRWNGADQNDAPVAFVGKGVTFDSGGISIKPATGMEDMKYDMAGSAAVVGVMKLLADRNAKVNAVGIVGLVENMPDGLAQRPSDVVHSMSGQTIEVLNTDAEGRLVLADALWYCQDRFKPKFIVDLATLTGAIVVTFGAIYAGLFSNNDELSERLTKVGEKTGEKLWRLPIGEEYDKQIDSQIADMQNIGNDKGAGSITAAQFLARFVNGTPWAHLDIAGVAWTKKDQEICPKGATAFGIRLLNQLISDYYE